MIENCVIDAGVGIKLFLAEPDSKIVERLFTRLAEEPEARFYVPDLFFIECANVLWKYARRFNYPVDNARNDLLDLQELDLIVVSTVDLLPAAFELAVEHDITAYDACYVSLAKLLGLPLVTADLKLAQRNRINPFGVDIKTLFDVDREI